MPKTVVLTPDRGARRASRTTSTQIVDAAVHCLGEAPPELAQDIIFQGIHLVGGGALLRGMSQRLADGTAVPVHLVDTPLECVALGAGRCLESFDRLLRRSSPPPTPERAPGGAIRPARSAAVGQQDLGRLADLPVPVRRAQRRRPPRPRVRRRRPGPRRPAAGRWACRRGRPARRRAPAGSPMAPRAATAASRHRVSGWVGPAPPRASTDGRGRRRSPRAQQAASATNGSSSPSATAERPAAPGVARARPRARRPRPPDGGPRGRRRRGRRSPRRRRGPPSGPGPRAPPPARRGSPSPRAARAVGSSPRCPASMTRRLRPAGSVRGSSGTTTEYDRGRAPRTRPLPRRPRPPGPGGAGPWCSGWSLVVVLALVIVASRINLNYYALTPGDAQPVDPLIRVPPGRATRSTARSS